MFHDTKFKVAKTDNGALYKLDEASSKKVDGITASGLGGQTKETPAEKINVEVDVNDPFLTAGIAVPLPGLPPIPIKSPEQLEEDRKLTNRIVAGLKALIKEKIRSEKTLTIFRVESADNQRISINSSGEVTVKGHKMLFYL